MSTQDGDKYHTDEIGKMRSLVNPKVLVFSPVIPSYSKHTSNEWRTWIVDSEGNLTRHMSLYDIKRMGV